MTEALGVMGSVVTIASAGIALAIRLHDRVDQFWNTFNDIEVIATDLNVFSIVLLLDELSKKLKQRPTLRGLFRISFFLVLRMEDEDKDKQSEGMGTENIQCASSKTLIV